MLDQLVSLCKRRGFVFQSSEIYGGLSGCWDFGPLGVELLRNIKDAWWKAMTWREDIDGLDASILMHPRVWEASGHVENFTDPMIDCRQCQARFRVDALVDSFSEKKKAEVAKGIVQFKPGVVTSDLEPHLMDAATFTFLVDNEFLVCPSCGNKKTLTIPRKFNLMFKTHVGPVEEAAAVVYLRPETAQGIYVNFLNVKEACRRKLPFGIAQYGKAFRNEINTKNFLFRTREFEQMEMQYFIRPEEDERWFEYWLEQRRMWYTRLGMPLEKLRFSPHPPDKLAHYAKRAVDIEYLFPFGWGEIEGIHNRTDFDLKRHTQFSGKKVEYFDQEKNERFTPYIIETSAGATRTLMAFLVNAYQEDEAPTADGKTEKRTVLRLHPALAPIKAAVLPLVNRDNMPEIARSLVTDLRTKFRVFYDDSGAIGRRYRRQDECGTPFCITIDSQTLTDKTVTIRERDSMQQTRVSMELLAGELEKKLGSAQ
jgi:glycyl-tRNA synthetase